jgi:phenylacetate-coenzyme A ligase PaaK-like adenylate-forming protein
MSMAGFIDICETTGETLYDDQRQEIEEYFNCQVINQYGCTETWAIAYAYAGADEMEVLQDNVVLELVTPVGHNIIVNKGEIGEVAVTCLPLRAMPIVRYMTGDRATWAPGGVGRRLRLEVDRRQNLIVLNKSVVSGAEAMRLLVNTALWHHGYCRLEFIQFVQLEENLILVRLGKSAESRGFFNTIERCLAQIGLSITPINLRYEEVSEEQIKLARGQKNPLFISKLDVSRFQ